MKSFDIFIDGRSVQSDLIVVNLTVRNDIAVYNWLTINSELINHIIAEKTMLPTPSGIALDARANAAIEKYEVVDAPVVVGADAEFKVLFPLTIDEGALELEQALQEVSQKIERVSLPVSVGTDDSVEVSPLKTLGGFDSIIEFETALSEVKNSIITGECGNKGLAVAAALSDPFAVYYESTTNEMYLGASVQSLSYLLHMRLIQSGVIVGADTIDFDLYRSLGKFSARIAVGADASFAVHFFADGESELELFSDAEVLPHKFFDAASDVELVCIGAAVLRRLRTLGEIDALGTLADIDGMSLDEMYYTDILE